MLIARPQLHQRARVLYSFRVPRCAGFVQQLHYTEARRQHRCRRVVTSSRASDAILSFSSLLQRKQSLLSNTIHDQTDTVFAHVYSNTDPKCRTSPFSFCESYSRIHFIAHQSAQGVGIYLQTVRAVIFLGR